MAFGLLSTGFNKKRIEDIKSELEASLRLSLGAGINLLPQSVLGQIVGTISERESLIWELAEGVYNSQYPDTANDVSLDNAVRLTGVTRKEATYSTVTMRILGTLGTAVPAGFMASVAGVASTRFVSLAPVTIGVGIDEVQLLSFSSIPTSGGFTLVFSGQSTSGLTFASSAANIATALNALSNLSGVTVTGTFGTGFSVTFAGADGKIDQPLMTVVANTLSSGTAVTVTVTETQKGYGPYADVSARAENAGVYAAIAGTLTTIETPLFGVTSVTNLLDAVVGKARETDSDLRLRRLTNLQRAGTASVEGIRTALLAVSQVTQALVVENVTSTVDGAGRPAKSFEAYVQGGTTADIIAAIWKSKAAGIESYGSISSTLLDSQGFTQTLKFSRPIAVPIYVSVTIVKNTNAAEGELYPATGDQLVQDAILAYGATFKIGQDVVTNRLYTPVNTVPGVIGLTITLGTAPSPVSSANISIGATSIATFSSSRLVIVSAP